MKTGFTSKLGCAAVASFLLCGDAWAAPYCGRPQDSMAVQVAALQQELMVAALMCHDVAAYNRFVRSHQGELQDSDKALMDFFVQQNAQTGFGDYNLFKTELANVSSYRSVRDPQFCLRNKANFGAAGSSKPLTQVLMELPYPVETGSMRCVTPYAYQASPTTYPMRRVRVRHRTWLGRLVDAIFH